MISWTCKSWAKTWFEAELTHLRWPDVDTTWKGTKKRKNVSKQASSSVNPLWDDRDPLKVSQRSSSNLRGKNASLFKKSFNSKNLVALLTKNPTLVMLDLSFAVRRNNIGKFLTSCAPALKVLRLNNTLDFSQRDFRNLLENLNCLEEFVALDSSG